MSEFSRIERVRLSNYKSIGECDVPLGPLNFLVGPNGSGKSNFLDALAFIADALTNGLDHAVRSRGSFRDVAHRSDMEVGFGIRIEFVAGGKVGDYTVSLVQTENGSFTVWREWLDIGLAHFHRENDHLFGDTPKPVVLADRLALVNYAGQKEFRPAFDFLTSFRSYNIAPSEMRLSKPVDPYQDLRSNGANAPATLRSLSKSARKDLCQTMQRIVPGFVDVTPRSIGGMESLTFTQEPERGSKQTWKFRADSMSDGTLRALGILIAINQPTKSGPLVIGIEEPETAIHPGALRVLLNAIREASETRQIIVTSHSADLLDDPDLPPESILVTEMVDGETKIGPMDNASRDAVKNALFTPGELLRQGQLERAESPPNA